MRNIHWLSAIITPLCPKNALSNNPGFPAFFCLLLVIRLKDNWRNQKHRKYEKILYWITHRTNSRSKRRWSSPTLLPTSAALSSMPSTLRLRSSGNYLGFPTIPAKFGEIFSDIFDLAEGSAKFEKKNQKICLKCGPFLDRQLLQQ